MICRNCTSASSGHRRSFVIVGPLLPKDPQIKKSRARSFVPEYGPASGAKLRRTLFEAIHSAPKNSPMMQQPSCTLALSPIAQRRKAPALVRNRGSAQSPFQSARRHEFISSDEASVNGRPENSCKGLSAPVGRFVLQSSPRPDSLASRPGLCNWRAAFRYLRTRSHSDCRALSAYLPRFPSFERFDASHCRH